MNCMNRYRFEKICKMSQSTLKKYVASQLKKTHKNIVVDDGFVYAEGTFPVLLVAHLDTVHEKLPNKFLYETDAKGNTKISSPNGIGGDDRCGVYMILDIIQKYNCSVLFCEEEERGCIGAGKFTKTKTALTIDCNYMIEFDRRGNKDAVFYDCDNPKFEDFICKGFFKTAWGSMSDISVLAPFVGCAAVNLSCGYYNAHTTSEYVIFEEMEKSIEEACKILDRTTKDDAFEYIPMVYSKKYGGTSTYGYGYGYGGWYEDDYYEPFAKDVLIEDEEIYYLIEYRNEDGVPCDYEVHAMSMEEAVGMFCIDHPTLTFSHILGILYDEESYI